ncbi:cytochrome P450 [Hamadaea tsunoensis]|uniref:cytochrome P450 n=1 Tax=Hamadaea tsunoensis TaxID=53368 RepID=UPI000416CD64|nr:cytochrome P450 [Hamadaea tsunoensis]
MTPARAKTPARETKPARAKTPAREKTPNWETRLNLAAHPLAYPFVRALGRRPVVRVPGLGVVVSDAALARRVLMDGETFRKDGPGSSGDLWTPILGPSVLLNMEGEAHRALRRRLQELFTPDYTARLCVRVLAEPLRDLVARLPEGVDLVDEMRVLAATVIGEVIGLSGGTRDDHRHLFEAGERIVGMVTLRTRTLSDRQKAVAQSVLGPIGETAAAAYRAGDETTVLGRMRGLGLSEAEARGAAAAFFLTGTETVATLVPRLIALLHDHGRLADVAADERLLDPAIDEAMRATVPTPVMLRSVHAAAAIGEVRVRPGDRVLIATINCCRAYGPFDPDRPQPPELKRLWFGAGPHFCIGFPLAHAEIRAVASALLAAPGLRVVERSAARGVLIPTYRRLVVRT